MQIEYSIVIEILNKVSKTTKKFTKEFQYDLAVQDETKLYGNEHIMSERFYILNAFSNEIDAYCAALGIQKESIEINEFEIASLTDNVDVFFESQDDNQSISMTPILKCYVEPKEDELTCSELTGKAYDDTTIIWEWEDDKSAHYLVDELPETMEITDPNILMSFPIGQTKYAETNLIPNTSYSRRLIAYNEMSVSAPSAPCVIKTDAAPMVKSLEKYKTPKNYDFTIDDTQRETVDERLKAFQSGIGDRNDLMLYKQMDTEFYEKFKAYIEIKGKRIEKENRYDQVGFNYKVCLEGTETIQEQEGEITFDIEAFPREEISLMQYFWATRPIKIKIKVEADVDLYRETGYTESEGVTKETSQVTCPCFNGVHFVFCFDMSSSMVGGKDANVKQSSKSLAKELFNTKVLNPQTGQQEYPKYYVSINGFAKGAGYGTSLIHNEHIGTPQEEDGAQAAIDAFDNAIDTELVFKESGGSIVNGTNVGSLTNWGAGLIASENTLAADNLGENVRRVIILLSDGAHNCDSNNNWVPTRSSGRNIAPAYNYLTSVINSLHVADDIWTIIDCDEVSNGIIRTKDVFWYPDVLKGGPANYIQAIATETSKGAALTSINGNPASPIIDTDNFANLTTKYANIISSYETKEITSTSNTGQEDFDNSLNMGEYETAHISAYVDYTISQGKNTDSGPEQGYIGVEYSSKEKRAVISSHLPSLTKVSTISLFDLLYPQIKETSSYQRGYHYTRNHYDGNKKVNGFIIKNVILSDSWVYADEDTTPDNTQINWSKANASMIGSIDIYTDLNDMETVDPEDDRYYCSDDNYLYIRGYAEGIIYDGTRYSISEINAYDHSSEVLVSYEKTYQEYLKNRMNKNEVYGVADGTIHAVLTFLEKGSDISVTGVTGITGPIELFKEYEITGLSNDIVATISAQYQSPVLNYRFNLEDPDAKTPYYEILEHCDPNSKYKHIVLLKVYYAKNVYVWDETEYLSLLEYDPKTNQGLNYKQYIRRDEWIDEYLWFFAEKMWKDIPYYDELPGKGIDSMYGLVNGRYRQDRKDGKLDLRVDAPQFNIPTSVTEKHSDSIRIYVKIVGVSPEDALVSYKWDHPYNSQNDITKVNGDYITFSSDTITIKNIEYTDLLATYNIVAQELFSTETKEMIYSVKKPESNKEYTNYYLKVSTDNGDVLPLYYPEELFFGESTETQVGVSFKGVVNATSKWSPKIHNGYYYINQKEYYAYSEFDVEADFDTQDEVAFDKINGYLTTKVSLYKTPDPSKSYAIDKWTRSELLPNEEKFMWIDDKGVTVKPYVDGLYYEKYVSQEYISPTILFPNVLTAPGKLLVDYQYEDGSDIGQLYVRSYNNELGTWNDWVAFENNTVPTCPMSNAYQIKTTMSVSTTDTAYSDDDYLCCYLDWKDDMEVANTENIVTITDHMTTGPYKAGGTFVSKVFNFLCPTSLMLEWYGSSGEITVQIAFSDNPNDLLLEHVQWKNWNTTDEDSKYQYYRYRVIIPEGEKLYWLHKTWTTLKSESIKPYLKEIKMTGKYAPEAKTDTFLNVEAFEITCDGNWQEVFANLGELIKSDVLVHGYELLDIRTIELSQSAPEIELKFNEDVLKEYPSEESMTTSIQAKTDVKYISQTYNTPFIFVKEGMMEITGTPQNFAPITVEDKDEKSYIQIHSNDFEQVEEWQVKEDTKYITLKTNQYDKDSLSVKIDDEVITEYELKNHFVIFTKMVEAGKKITVSYCITRSFIADINYQTNKTILKFYSGKDIPMPEKLKVFFETNKNNNKFNADISFNPIYRTDYKGFIYLTHDHNDAHHVNIYCNPRCLFAGGYDKVDVIVEVLDIINNPVIGKEVDMDCECGVLQCDSNATDANGVIHCIYQSSYLPSTDTIKASIILDDSSVIEEKIVITNEERK